MGLLAKLVLLTAALGGCSLLYNPNELPVAADAPVEVDPCNPQITDITPSIVVEGAGEGGSRPAVIVIRGRSFVNQNTSVSLKAAPAASRIPMILVDNAKLEVEANGLRLAVPVALPVDPTLPGDASIPLEVALSQDCPTGTVTTMIAEKLTLRGLDELAEVPAEGLPAGLNEYSKIEMATGTIKARDNATEPLLLRSRSSVTIADVVAVTASARMQAGGPGGGTGGDGGGAISQPGTAGQGPSGGQPSGMPGGFTSADPQLSTLGNPNRGSGGSGGSGGTANAGGFGGGGGGTIEISAAGSLAVGNISAKGAAGQDGVVNSGAGGAGSGGVILLRAGGDLTSEALDVLGGGTGASAGAPGRVRFDAGGTVTMPACNACYQGPMFVDPPLITRLATPELMVAGKPASNFRYFIVSDTGDATQPVSAAIGSGGTARITLRDELDRGWNEVCLIVEGASTSSDTRNCIEIAYLQ